MPRDSRKPDGPGISDHALLRYMERAYGVDVEAWRALMQADLDAGLAAFDGWPATRGPCFIVSPDGTTLTFLGKGAIVTRPNTGIAIQRIAP